MQRLILSQQRARCLFAGPSIGLRRGISGIKTVAAGRGNRLRAASVWEQVI